MTTSTTVPADAVDITDYGAVSNPDDASAAEAERNLDALIDAIEAAGEGGTVYVPEGSFYVGDGSVANLTMLGEREPGGISFVGDGPTVSTIGVSGQQDHPNLNFLIYWEDHDHGEVLFRDIGLDGNYERLPNLYENDGGSRGINCRGKQGSLICENVWFRGWYQNAAFASGMSARFERCSFEEIAVGLNEDSPSGSYGDGNRVAHCSVASDGVTYRQCEFRNCPGQVLDTGGGNATFERCWGRGLGTGVVKINAAETVTIRNCYFEPRTDDIEEEFEGFSGRHMAHMLKRDDSGTPTLRVVESVVEDMVKDAVLLYGRENDARLRIAGRDFAIRQAGREEYRYAFQASNSDGESGATLIFDVESMSVHDTDGEVFALENGVGTIQELRRDGNDGLGDPDDVTIETDRPGADTVRPDVPARDDVGINSGDSGGGDDDVNVPEVGGYEPPTRGDEDWHRTLNDTFETIATDVTALDEVLAELEDR